MDGILILALHNSLQRLSKKNWKRLMKLSEGDTLSLKARKKLLNAITKPKVTSKVPHLPASKNLTQLHEII